MREKKDSNIVLGFFLRPLIKNEELILNHLKISAKFKIIQRIVNFNNTLKNLCLIQNFN